MAEIDEEVAEVQAIIDGLRARLEAAQAEVGKARIDTTGPGHHKARRWARGEERRYTLRWLRAHGNLSACEAADSIEAGEHRPEGRHGVPTATEWDSLRARAEAAEAALAAVHAEVAQIRADRAVLIGAFLSSLSPAVALDVLSGVGAPHNAAEALSIFSRNGLLPIEGEKKGPELLSYLRKMLARVFAEIKAGGIQ